MTEFEQALDTQRAEICWNEERCRMGMFSNIRNSMTTAKNVMREFEEQARQHAGQQAGPAGASEQQAGRPGAGEQPTAGFRAVPPPPPASAHPFGPASSPGQPFGTGARSPQPPRPLFTDLDIIAMSTTSDDAHRRRDPRRMIYLLTALVLTGFAAWMLIGGIVDIVHDGANIRRSAVAEGIVSTPSAPTGEVTFVAGAAGTYSVYVDLDTSSEERRDVIVGGISCLARFPDGNVADLVGNRQNSSSTYGDLSTVGIFTAPEGQVSISCGRSNEQAVDGNVRYYVTPGRPNLLGSIVKIFTGAGMLAVALVFTIAGFRRPKYVGGRNYPTVVA